MDYVKLLGSSIILSGSIMAVTGYFTYLYLKKKRSR